MKTTNEIARSNLQTYQIGFLQSCFKTAEPVMPFAPEISATFGVSGEAIVEFAEFGINLL